MQPSLFGNIVLSDQIVLYSELSAFENALKNELSGKSLDSRKFGLADAFDVLSAVVANRGGTVVDDELLYKFGVFSDIHLSKTADDPDNVGDGNGKLDFARGLSCANNHGVEFVCIAGDIGLTKTQHEQTERLYDEAISASGAGFPISCCTGNHDTVITEDMWRSITSCDFDYSRLIGDDLFVFMSLPIHPDRDAGWYYDEWRPYSDDTVAFLSSTLLENPGKNVFLFMHFPLNSEMPEQFAGLGNYYYPGVNMVGTSGTDPIGEQCAGINYEGFRLSSNDEYKDERNYRNDQNHLLLDMINAYDGTVTVFNGHSHYVFEVDQDIPNVIFSRIGARAHSVHVPSLNYPRNRNRKQIVGKCPAKAPSQGYIVERRRSKLVLKGYDFNARISPEFGDLKRTYSIDLI